MPHMSASLRLPSFVLVKKEMSLLLVYNIIKHIQKHNPGAHQDLNDCKIQFQVTGAHKGTMCDIQQGLRDVAHPYLPQACIYQ